MAFNNFARRAESHRIETHEHHYLLLEIDYSWGGSSLISEGLEVCYIKGT